VPVTAVSRLTVYALSEALSLGSEVIAVTVAVEGGDEGAAQGSALQAEWAKWDPGVPLRVLQAEYSSVVEPITSFIDELRARDDRQIVVLIPAVIPDRVRYRILHNQLDLVLSGALRSRPDVVVARVQLPTSSLGERRASRRPAAGKSPSPEASGRRSR
jgi:hypothetical protein